LRTPDGLIANLDNAYAMPYESGIMLWPCRGLRPSLDAFWPSLKRYE
jgi:hypothetical protein